MTATPSTDALLRGLRYLADILRSPYNPEAALALARGEVERLAELREQELAGGVEEIFAADFIEE